MFGSAWLAASESVELVASFLVCFKILKLLPNNSDFFQDVKYLSPYLEEVQKEFQEKFDWNKQ